MESILSQKLGELVRQNYWSWQLLCGAICLGGVWLIQTLRQTRNGQADIFDGSPLTQTGPSIVAITVASLTLFLSLTMISGIPQPSTHDEFCYLFAADTFSHGRLANPTPVSPRSFESFHVLVTPVYASKYPPMQGVFLAIGRVATGYPIAGVWLSSLLAAVAIWWLLRSSLTSEWSLWGAFLWICSPLNIIWSGYYWGGHVAVLGGALSLGAFFRLHKRSDPVYAIIWGVGIFLLLHSRPFEGGLLSLALTLLALAFTLRRKMFKEYRTTAVVFSVMLAAAFASIAGYNFALTLDPLLMPYTLHQQQYHRTPLFAFQDIAGPRENVPPFIERLDKRWTSDLEADFGTPSAVLLTTVKRALIFPAWLTRSPFLLTLLLIGSYVLISRRTRLDINIMTIVAVAAAGLFVTTFTGDRFISPLVGLGVVVMSLGAYRGMEWAPSWKPLIAMIPLIVVGGYLSGMISDESSRRLLMSEDRSFAGGFATRQQIEQTLRASSGKDIVFVATDNVSPADPRFYVYNDADLDAAEIIWVHRLGSTEDQIVADRFAGRRAWLLQNIEGTVSLSPSSDRP